MSIELKIKSKHLGEEARIIRFEEQKLKRYIAYTRRIEKEDIVAVSQLTSITFHRKWDVRNENRATFLARAYLAGKPYSYAETKRRKDKEPVFQGNILPRVLAMVVKYGPVSKRWRNQVTMEELREWSKVDIAALADVVIAEV
jgi:hypothetical protein